MSNITATIIQDSLSRRWGHEARLTTFLLEYPRYIHAELMTHRCLAADTELVFDLPAGAKRSRLCAHRVPIGEFCDRWNNGAKKHRASRVKALDPASITPELVYTARELADLTGAGASNIRGLCRAGKVPPQNPFKSRSQDYLIRGSDYLSYRANAGVRTYDLRPRLGRMRLRMLNEVSGEIEHTHVTDCWKVGDKHTFMVEAGEYSITATEDHRILTASGWKEVQELTLNDALVVTAKGVTSYKDPIRHKKINGQWTATWNRKALRDMTASQQSRCSHCGKEAKLEIHHLAPVHQNPEKAFDETNVVAVCGECHRGHFHNKQGWQVEQRILPKTTQVTQITSKGIQPVYDISVASEFHNFVANDIVVHNCFSRNAASSRAIPVETLVQQTVDNPVTPIHWGQNQPGMVVAGELPEDLRRQANKSWRSAAYQARHHARELARLGVHKQVANRVLEPFQHIRVLLTGTDFENFFTLRTHADAQPEIQRLARMMRKAYYNAEPMQLYRGEWHVPYVERVRDVMGTLRYYIDGLELDAEEALKVSASAAAQTSYRKNDLTLDKAEAIYRRLVTAKPVHASPFEHQATPLFWARSRCRNFRGWKQYRTFIEGETVHDRT